MFPPGNNFFFYCRLGFKSKILCSPLFCLILQRLLSLDLCLLLGLFFALPGVERQSDGDHSVSQEAPEVFTDLGHTQDTLAGKG